ncbi:MAG: class I SAM-dependent methyltransferase [Chloroflexi bacterium]|nr:class I SAM-dependent methyltransferase [Chloroflexota bacterium]
MNRGTDFSFDERIVSLYNRQRAHPPEIARQIGAAIMAQLPDGARLLEIGIGTGRIGWPVAAAGGRVTGFDLSAQMLSQVYGDERPAEIAGALALAQADMQQMPFAADSFDGALAVHVLHLAQDWQRVIREVARVLRPGGVFIQGDDWIDPASVVGRLRDELRMHAVRLDPNLMPPAAGISKAQALADLGGTDVTEIVVAEWTAMISPAERLATVEARIDAESWIFTDAQFAQVLDHLRGFAADLWPNLDEQQPVTRRFVLKITRGAWHTGG